MFNDPSLKCSLYRKTDRYKAAVVTLNFQSLDEKKTVNLATSVPDLHVHFLQKNTFTGVAHTELECFLIKTVVIQPKYTTRMHSSRMRIGRSSSHPGSLHQAPWEQAPPGTRPSP